MVELSNEEGKPHAITPNEIQQIKKMTNEQVFWFRGFFQGHVDEIKRALDHYGSRLATLEQEVRKRKKAGGWDEEKIKQELDKIVFLAKQKVTSVEELLGIYAQESGEVSNVERVEDKNYKQEPTDNKPRIIIP